MRIVAAVGVKDEADLIDRAIDHLRSIGAVVVIVCDMYSTDGTAELVRARAADGVVLIQMSDRASQAEWSSHVLSAVRDAAADWMFFVDADELPLPSTGSLHQTAALSDADVVVLERYNVPLLRDGPAMPVRVTPDRYGDLFLLVEPIPDFWRHLSEHPQTSWMRKKLAKRVMARVECVESIGVGGHNVVGAGRRPLRRLSASDLVVAHIPFTSRDRFRRKVVNARHLLQNHDAAHGPAFARHWRRWVELDDAGRLDEEFRRMVLSEEELSDLLHQGVVRSAADLLGHDRVSRA